MCMRAATALVRLRGYAASPEPSQLTYVISNKTFIEMAELYPIDKHLSYFRHAYMFIYDSRSLIHNIHCSTNESILILRLHHFLFQMFKKQNCHICFSKVKKHKQIIEMNRDMRFPTMWHFDKCKLRRACASS